MKIPSKSTVETLKTIVIVALVVGITAFIGGMKYQQRTNAQVHAEAKAMATVQSKR